MALPPVNVEDSNSDPNMLSANTTPDIPPIEGPLIPDLPNIPESRPPDATSAGDQSIPDMQNKPGSPPPVPGEPQLPDADAPPGDIVSGTQLSRDSVVLDIPGETPTKSIPNNFLDEIFGGSSTSEEQTPQIENATPELPETPPSEFPLPSFQTFQCHQCHTVNPVTNGTRPTVVTCAACGAKGYLEK